MSSKINQLKGGVLLSYVSIFVNNAVSIVYTPIMIRMLGQSEYGLYNLVSSFVSYLGLLSFGFDNTYMRYYTQYKHTKSEKEVASLNGMFLLVFTAIGAVAAVAGLVLSQYSDAIFGSNLTSDELVTAKRLMILLVINLAIAFPSNLFRTFINANEKFVFVKSINLIKTIVNPFVVLPLLFFGYKSYALVLSTLLYSVVIDTINIFYCFRKLDLKIRFRGFDFSVFRGVAAFSFFIFLGEIVDEVNWQLDKFLLGRFCGTISVAVYGVASTLSNFFRQFSTSISSVFSPRVNKIVATNNDNDMLLDLMIRVGRVQFIVLSLVAIGFIFFGQEFCVLWAGEEYRDSYLIALFLMIPSIIPLIQNVGISILVARNKHKFRSVAYFLIALLNLAISIPLCQKYEGLGCAIGTGVSMIIGNGVLMNLYYCKMGLRMGRFWMSILSLCKGLVLPIIIACGMLLVETQYSWLDLIIRILLFVLAFSFSMYFFGINFEEKEKIDQYISRILER